MASTDTVRAIFGLFEDAGLKPPGAWASPERAKSGLKVYEVILSGASDTEAMMAALSYLESPDAKWWPTPGVLKSHPIGGAVGVGRFRSLLGQSFVGHQCPRIRRPTGEDLGSGPGPRKEPGYACRAVGCRWMADVVHIRGRNQCSQPRQLQGGLPHSQHAHSDRVKTDGCDPDAGDSGTQDDWRVARAATRLLCDTLLPPKAD